MNEIITRSGYLMIKPNVSFEDSNLTDGVKCKLGIVPKDFEKVVGKPIYISIKGVTPNAFTASVFPIKIDYGGGYSLTFRYGAQDVAIYASDDNIDDWTMMYD